MGTHLESRPLPALGPVRNPVLEHRVRLFSLVPLVWESNPKLQGLGFRGHRGCTRRCLSRAGVLGSLTRPAVRGVGGGFRSKVASEAPAD